MSAATRLCLAVLAASLTSSELFATDSDDALLGALGSVEGEKRFDPAVDLNHDGAIDARDVALHRGLRAGEGGTAGSGATTLIVDERSILAAPGATVRLKVRLLNCDTPLIGYSAALRAVPLAGATGAVTANAQTSSFFPPRNIILAAPAPPALDPVFSVIVPLAQGGVFVNANTADGSAVTSVMEVNDTLAEIAFDVGATAHGVFEVQLGPASALANASGQGAPFRICLARISVAVPEVRPGDLNGNGVIGGEDLALLLGSWGGCPEMGCPADLNCDGAVNGLDMATLLSDWN